MPRPSPTLREIAAKLGVSHTSVSLALRNHPSLPEATRLRIQQAAKEMGYRSNLLVRALMAQVRQRNVKQRGEVLTWLTTLPPDEWKKLSSISMGLEVATRRAEELGARLDVMYMGAKGELWPRVRRTLDARGIRGLLLPPSLPLDLLPLQIPWDRFAVVSVSYSFRQAEVHRVVNAHFNGMLTCYQKLRALGHERIGLVLLRDDDDRAHNYWLSGALGASSLYGGTPIPPLLLRAPDDRQSFKTWFARQKPDAVIGLSPDFILACLRECGVSVPEDVSYVCLDVLDRSRRSLAGIYQSWGEIFSTGVELLADQLSRNQTGLPSVPKVTLIDGVWYDGDTIGRRA